MSQIHIQRKHALPAAAVRARVDKMVEQLRSEYGVASEWKTNRRVEFVRSGARFSVEFSDELIEVSGKLGLFLGAMRGSIERTIEQTLAREFGGGAG